jgi:hypothetical protein
MSVIWDRRGISLKTSVGGTAYVNGVDTGGNINMNFHQITLLLAPSGPSDAVNLGTLTDRAEYMIVFAGDASTDTGLEYFCYNGNCQDLSCVKTLGAIDDAWYWIAPFDGIFKRYTWANENTNFNKLFDVRTVGGASSSFNVGGTSNGTATFSKTFSTGDRISVSKTNGTTEWGEACFTLYFIRT